MSQVLKDKTFLNTFWSLAEDEIDNRVKGGCTLVNILIEQQMIHEKAGNSEKVSPEVKYALRRLVRGIASPRYSARLGFASTLTEILDRIRAIHLTDVFELMDVELDIESKTIEERELIFGNIIAYHAIIQTQRITGEKGGMINKLVREVRKLAKHKSYLHDICYQALVDLVKKISEKVFAKHVWPDVKSEFKGWDQSKPNSLALLYVCRDKFPGTVTSQFVEEAYGNQLIFHQENFKEIQTLLIKASTTYNMNCIVLEDQLAAHLLKNRKLMKEFWNQVIENGLCLDTSCACIHIFNLLERLLPSCKEKDIPDLFSPKVAEFLLEKLAKRKDKGRTREDLISFTQRLPSLVAALPTSSQQISVLRCLFSSPGYIHFDAITRTKTLASVISSLNGEGLKMYLEWLKELFFKDTSKADIAGVRRWICKQMLMLMKNPNVQREEGWMMEAAQFFFLHGFFEVQNQVPDPPITSDLREELVQYFYTALEILSNSPPFQDKPDVWHHGVAPDGSLRIFSLVKYAKSLLSSDSAECLTPFTTEIQETWENMISTVTQIQKKYSDGPSSTAGLAFQLIFLQIGLQTFREPKQCAEILEDLQECFERAMGKEGRSKKKKTDETEWMEVIVDILISLLAKSSHLLRTVVEHSFKIICSNLTEISLQLILDIFDPEKDKLTSLMSLEGEESDDEDEELIEDEDAMEEEEKLSNGTKILKKDDEDSDSSDEDDDEDMAPVDVAFRKQVKNALGNAGVLKKEKKDDEDSDSSDEDDDDEDMAPVDVAFRKQVKNALGNAGVLKKEEDDESDIELTDEAMMALDGTLADVFRLNQKKTTKIDSKANEETIVHFKLRAFQLLDIFTKRNPESPLLIKIAYPLVVIAGTVKGQRDAMVLAERAAQLLHHRFYKARRFPPSITTDNVKYISETLERLLNKAKNAHSLKTVTQISHCCAYMVKVMNSCRNNTNSGEQKTSNPVELDGIKSLYLSALEDFMTKRSTNLQPVFFLDLIQKVPDVAWLMVEEFAVYISTGILAYRQTQACVMLSTICKTQFKGSENERAHLVTTIQTSLNTAISNVLKNAENTKPKLTREILVAVQQFAVFAHKSNEPPDLSELVSSLEKMKATVKSPVFIATVVQNSINAVLNRSGKNKRKRKRAKKDAR